MDVPFSTGQFLDTFARYNQAVWPAQVLFYVLAAAVAWLALRPRAGSSRLVIAALALLWAWMGIVYHWGFFAPVNPAAALFGTLFVAQATLLLQAGLFRPRLPFRAAAGLEGTAGAVLIAYALVGYPLLGYLLGQRYPHVPTFGLPCPTTIFTFGVLLWADARVPVRLLVIPAAWSLLGASAAYQHGIVQDYGLLAAGAVATTLILRRNARPHRASAAALPAPRRRPPVSWKTSPRRKGAVR
ncbi:MAG TPA: DUF6064 family protein [Longimicrobium sp.]|nr:DUF6064 family protein [Longimicrobium sp.]